MTRRAAVVVTAWAAVNAAFIVTLAWSVAAYTGEALAGAIARTALQYLIVFPIVFGLLMASDWTKESTDR